MRIYNTITRKTEEFTPYDSNNVRVYSCGPTVYDHIHIGNLSSFIAADLLHRALKAIGHDVVHVMNFTDVDDKTIRRSRERFPDDAPEISLQKLTGEYKEIFLDDMQAIGNDVGALTFVSAVDTIPQMQDLIRQLHTNGFAYIADDGVYFSIEKYRSSGKKYGQLTEITESSTGEARIQNDEYDKESAHDFALWKTHKEGEPSWEFELDGHNLSGRPGWHIECSVMSAQNLGQPFDIHTGGVDLIFPHHENEIAQSTAGQENPVYAKYFVHNEHLLVDGRKMSKSLNNFFTLQDVRERGFDPLAFRMLVLQSHYQSQSNFTWDNLQAASNRLKSLRAMADLRWQTVEGPEDEDFITLLTETVPAAILTNIGDNLNTPGILASLSKYEPLITDGYRTESRELFTHFLQQLDDLLGLQLLGSKDITDEQKQILAERQAVRDNKDFTKSDELRDRLKEQGIEVRDTSTGQIWSRT